MNDEDDTDRETSTSAKATPRRQREGASIGAALEASLQAGLRSLSDGLEKVTGDDTTGRASPRGGLRPRPSTARTRANRTRRADRVRRGRTNRTRTSESDDCLIDTRVTDGEFVVVADIPGARKDDVSVGINPKTNQLVVSKTGTVVGRVNLPWTSPETTNVWFKNGILEVYMAPKDPESPTESPF